MHTDLRRFAAAAASPRSAVFMGPGYALRAFRDDI
jgi:hypothetical protein